MHLYAYTQARKCVHAAETDGACTRCRDLSSARVKEAPDAALCTWPALPLSPAHTLSLPNQRPSFLPFVYAYVYATIVACARLPVAVAGQARASSVPLAPGTMAMALSGCPNPMLTAHLAEWFVHVLGADEDGAAAAVAAAAVAGVELNRAAAAPVAAALSLLATTLARAIAAPAHARAASGAPPPTTGAEPTTSRDDAWLETANVDKSLPSLPPGATIGRADAGRLRKLLRAMQAPGAPGATSSSLSSSAAGGGGLVAVSEMGGHAATVADVTAALAALPAGLADAVRGERDPTRLWMSAAELAHECAAAAAAADTPAQLDVAATAKLQRALSLLLEVAAQTYPLGAMPAGLTRMPLMCVCGGGVQHVLQTVGHVVLATGRTRATDADVADALAALEGWLDYAKVGGKALN
jgi:hypothetical protein